MGAVIVDRTRNLIVTTHMYVNFANPQILCGTFLKQLAKYDAIISITTILLEKKFSRADVFLPDVFLQAPHL